MALRNQAYKHHVDHPSTLFAYHSIKSIAVLWVMMSTGQHTQGTSTLVGDGVLFFQGVPAYMKREKKATIAAPSAGES